MLMVQKIRAQIASEERVIRAARAHYQAARFTVDKIETQEVCLHLESDAASRLYELRRDLAGILRSAA